MKKNQQIKILITMDKKPNKWFVVSDFQRSNWIRNSLFIGYESGTRIGDLDRLGFLYKRRKGRFMEYKINDSGRLYIQYFGFLLSNAKKQMILKITKIIIWGLGLYSIIEAIRDMLKKK